MSASLELGNGNWAVKSDSLLGYKTINGEYYPREFTVTRATTATRVNPQGLVELTPYNLISWSEMFSDASWTKSATTLTANTTTAPDGTLTADTLIENTANSSHQVFQSITSVNGANAYTATIYVKQNTNRNVALRVQDGAFTYGQAIVTYNLNTGALISQSVSINGVIVNTSATLVNGYYRIQLTFTINLSTSFRYDILMVNGTSNSYLGDGVSNIIIWGAQLVEGTQPLNYLPTTDRLDIARIDYSLGSANLLLETQRTNVLLNSIWSGGVTNPTSWNLNVGSAGTSTPVASIKTTLATAYRFIINSQRRYFIQNVSITNGTTYSWSIYVESVVDSIQIQNMLNCFALGSQVFTKNGVSISPSEEVQAGFRYTLTGTATSTITAEFRVGGGVGGADIADITISMPQLEVGAYATSYIPTTTASVTRNVDSIIKSDIFTNGLITSAGGTWFVEFRNNLSYIRDASTGGLYLSDATSLSFGFRIKTYSPNNRLAIAKVIAGIETPIYTTTSDTFKLAIKWNGTTADVFVNGVKVASATAFTDTAMQIISTSISVPLFINQMKLYPTPLSDSELISLTTL